MAHAHYIANVETEEIEGIGAGYYVSLQIWSEDGREEYNKVGPMFEKREADEVAAFWMTGGHTMTMRLVKQAEPEHDGQYDDYPDPTDIEEMKYC